VITKIIEGSDGGAYGKWLVGQLDEHERSRKTSLPGYEGNASIWTFAGARRFGADPGAVFVLDLQTGQGAVFNPTTSSSPDYDLDQANIWVCPLFRDFFRWLYTQDLADVTQLPNFIDLPWKIELEAAEAIRDADGNLHSLDERDPH
jgi:hypothetical protein